MTSSQPVPEPPVNSSSSTFKDGRVVTSSPFKENLGSNTIVVTEDKVRLAVRDHTDRLTARGSWITPLSLLATVITVFVSADFRAALTIPAAVWEALFLGGGLASAIWLARTLLALWKVRGVDPEREFIDSIRGTAER